MNIIFPIAGPKLVFTDGFGNEYCKPLIEVNGKPLIEFLFSTVNASLPGKNNYIFVVNQSDCSKFSLDSVIKLLSDTAQIVMLRQFTQGSLCSCLMALGHIKTDEELLIVNGDQVIEHSLDKILAYFREKNADGGLVTFDSIHPKWSYVKCEFADIVIETSEKKPISRNASTGIYYFKRAGDFIDAAKNVIRKDANINGYFYVTSTYNEMILKNKLIIHYKIPNEEFFALDTPETVESFVRHLKKV